MPTRTARATWNGTLREGNGTFQGESGAINADYSFGSRFDQATGSNPEELLAAAQAACYSMALSGALEHNGTPATRVDTEAKCTIAPVEGGFTITTMHLNVRAIVPSIDDATFQKLAAETKTGCPVSKALAGNLEFTLEASLVEDLPASQVETASRRGGTFPNIRV